MELQTPREQREDLRPGLDDLLTIIEHQQDGLR
jgi:hypothetical protein